MFRDRASARRGRFDYDARFTNASGFGCGVFPLGVWCRAVDADGGDSVSYEWPGDRAHLKWLVRRIADEACNRIDDPRNQAKGNGWGEMDWSELWVLATEEEVEFQRATEDGDGDPIWEAADKLVIDAMRVDKASGKES